MANLYRLKSHAVEKALNRMLDLMQERGGDFTNKIVGISHSDDVALRMKQKPLSRSVFHLKLCKLP